MKALQARRTISRKMKSMSINLLVHKVELEAQNESLRQARHERELTLERYVDLFDFAPLGLTRLSPRGIIEEVNHVACGFLGFPKERLLGKPFLTFILDEDLQIFLDHLYEAGRGQGQLACELRLRVGREHTLPVRLLTHMRRSMVEQKFSYGMAIIDLTEQRRIDAVRAELASAEAQRVEAEVANKAKSAFLATVSHEMRTPLTSILGFGQILLNNGNLAGEQLRYVQTMVRNSLHLLGIMNDILDLAKIEADRLDLERLEFSIPGLFDELRASFTPLAERKNIVLGIRMEGPVPLRMTSDVARLRQVLNNVVGNALKFTTEGSVEVIVRSDTNGDSCRKLRISVSDTGPGLSDQEIGRLFQPFMQGDPSISRRYGGTGLGLVLSRRLARALGGDLVLLSSEVGVGCVFEITVDALEPRWRPRLKSEIREPASQARVQRPTESGSIEGTRVLVVEDSHDIQEFIALVLRREGAQVEIVGDSDEGVRKALDETFDVVLMDLEMPRTDGCAATKALRSQGYGKPIIALTANTIREDRERVFRSGFSGYLAKPLDKGELLRMVCMFDSGTGAPGQ